MRKTGIYRLMSDRNISDQQVADIINSYGYRLTLAPMYRINNGWMDGELIPSNWVVFTIVHEENNGLAFFDKKATADDIRTIRRVTLY